MINEENDPVLEKSDQYSIKDFYIIDNHSGDKKRRIYIREILDFDCHEYKTSIISDRERFKIINELKFIRLVAVLDNYYKANNKNYNAINTATFALISILKSVNVFI